MNIPSSRARLPRNPHPRPVPQGRKIPNPLFTLEGSPAPSRRRRDRIRTTIPNPTLRARGRSRKFRASKGPPAAIQPLPQPHVGLHRERNFGGGPSRRASQGFFVQQTIRHRRAKLARTGRGTFSPKGNSTCRIETLRKKKNPHRKHSSKPRSSAVPRPPRKASRRPGAGDLAKFGQDFH